MSKIRTIRMWIKKVIPKLSTLKNLKKPIKWTYTHSYPLYPQKSMWRTMIYIMKNKTNVLYISDKSLFRQKLCGKSIDFVICRI